MYHDDHSSQVKTDHMEIQFLVVCFLWLWQGSFSMDLILYYVLLTSGHTEMGSRFYSIYHCKTQIGRIYGIPYLHPHNYKLDTLQTDNI